MAVLLSGGVQRLVLWPLLRNLVEPNIRNGMRIDFFAHLHMGEAKFWIGRDAGIRGEPWSKDLPAQNITELVCVFARTVGVTLCESELVLGEVLPPLPQDAAHRGRITLYSPIGKSDRQRNTGAGLLKRWVGLESVWARAKEAERRMGKLYDIVFVARDDQFWAFPYIIQPFWFKGRGTMNHISMDCFKFGGVNDKAQIIGRGAAEHVLNLFTMWMHATHPRLNRVVNAEVFLKIVGMMAGVNFVYVKDIPMALSGYKGGGIICFRKQTLRGAHQCYGDPNLFVFFHTWACESKFVGDFHDSKTMEPGVHMIHLALRQHAFPSRRPALLTLLTSSTLAMMENMLCSLDQFNLRQYVIVISFEPGLCGAVSGVEMCVDMPVFPKMYALHGNVLDKAKRLKLTHLMKLHVMTVVLMSGYRSNTLFLEPHTVFLKSPLALYFEADTREKHIIFGSQSALQKDAKTCVEEDSSAVYQGVSDSIYSARDTPQAVIVMLNALELIIAKKTHKHLALKASAITFHQAVRMGIWPCTTVANGNVYWGHSEVAMDASATGGPVAIQASWINPEQRQECFRTSGLWRLPAAWTPMPGKMQCLPAQPMAAVRADIQPGGWVGSCSAADAPDAAVT